MSHGGPAIDLKGGGKFNSHRPRPRPILLNAALTEVANDTQYLTKLAQKLKWHPYCLSNAMHGQNMCVSVCVSVTLSVNSPTGQTPQRIFTADSLKDADLRKDMPLVHLAGE